MLSTSLQYAAQSRDDVNARGERISRRSAVATGSSTQLTRQIGEHLVAAELGRRGFFAAPFAGNVPDFDLLAADPSGRTVPVQVKAIQGASWQFDVGKYLDIEFVSVSKEQRIRGKKVLLNPHIVCVFVRLGKDRDDDVFYIFPITELQEFFFKNYKDCHRPKNWEATHGAIWPKDLPERYKDNWDILKKALERQ